MLQVISGSACGIRINRRSVWPTWQPSSPVLLEEVYTLVGRLICSSAATAYSRTIAYSSSYMTAARPRTAASVPFPIPGTPCSAPLHIRTSALTAAHRTNGWASRSAIVRASFPAPIVPKAFAAFRRTHSDSSSRARINAGTAPVEGSPTSPSVSAAVARTHQGELSFSSETNAGTAGDPIALKAFAALSRIGSSVVSPG